MTFLLILPFLFSGFVQKWYIPAGMIGECGRILVSDTDRDGNYEFIFTTYGGSYTIYFYELHLPDTWEIDSLPDLNQPLLWDIVDFDLDGLYDLVMQSSWGAPLIGITVFESPDSFSYPTQEVWRDTVGFPLVQPISVYDVDKDSFPEIFKLGWKKEDSITTYYPFGIYECIGNNQYDTIFMGDGLGSLSSTIAFEDFDSDGLNEFIVGNIQGRYQLWECLGNNNYQLLHQLQLSTANIKDCFSVPDADEDGKIEFVVKGYVVLGPPDYKIHAYIFEATADNTYEVIKKFTLDYSSTMSYYGGYSDAGDVDGDSVPEIVLEGSDNVYVIKSAGNDSFYIWDTLPGNESGSNIRVTNDIDGNGLSEIVISGNNETRIYEYDAGGIKERKSLIHTAQLIISPNPFKDKVAIRYSIPDNDKIAVKVYDVTGRIVKKVYKGSTANNPIIYWSGHDEHGGTVAQGVYFVQVQNLDSGETFCEKVLKIK